ncbi:hypothetical protein H8356DRAFT_1071526 [Neocallimastix lanati (nom. inval.)]|nr:hypothetical protein H8356DRAFT_1071526 [Neocallimastix sp. JGI-2020a]
MRLFIKKFIYDNNFCDNIPSIPSTCALKIDNNPNIGSDCSNSSISKSRGSITQEEESNLTKIILIIVGTVLVIILGILFLYFRKRAANNKKETKIEGPSKIIDIHSSEILPSLNKHISDDNIVPGIPLDKTIMSNGINESNGNINSDGFGNSFSNPLIQNTRTNVILTAPNLSDVYSSSNKEYN